MSTDYKIKELSKDGLTVEWEISIPAKPVLDKLEAELEERQKTFKLAGYREGKVPVQMVRKHVGPDVMAKIIEVEVDDTLRNVLTEKEIKPAMQPLVEISSFDEKTDLVFKAKIEALPEVPEVNWKDIEIETFKVTASQEDIDRAISEIKDKFKTFKEADASAVAKKGDAVIIDFHGTVNGKDFDGNKAQGIRLELGSGQFVPGFEDQLIGSKAGSQVKVRVTFPKNYGSAELAGKPAVFDVKVVQVLIPESVSEVDDEFAKKLGLESAEKLLELIRDKITADFNGLARLSMKKRLFDKIDSVYRFEIPHGMIKLDFDTMWKELKAQKQANPEMFRGKNEDDMKKEYEEIAKRRVRLGIILADIAKNHNIEVGDADLQQAVFAEAMLRPGQEKIVMDFYAKPENLDRLKGPILEEKAVDLILTLVQRKEVEISSKEFFDKYSEELSSMASSNR